MYYFFCTIMTAHFRQFRQFRAHHYLTYQKLLESTKLIRNQLISNLVLGGFQHSCGRKASDWIRSERNSAPKQNSVRNGMEKISEFLPFGNMEEIPYFFRSFSVFGIG
eukprot:TRINITY_DN1602_c0_g1_i3.p6 TRINITY_DN1602_c0_g1~~TRINITY_DN1602_c0_g1_i3.p6  ORF type:complete len:108 (+),score=4.86 TRINITY_DN1602_c0_g1_i3:390-713(+)